MKAVNEVFFTKTFSKFDLDKAYKYKTVDFGKAVGGA